ncbi:MAG TPA: alpha/beta hydrolase [Rhabdaerophilum sp.]|nr:alpha/beta hydrolase [Rhabdaerophilum sp.]
MNLPLPKALRIVRWPLALAAILYLAAAGYMAINQRAFLYRVAPAWVAPESQNIPRAESYALTMPDGVALRGWRVPPANPEAVTFLYFHGNANGLDRRAGRFRLMTADGSGLVALSYRGYGGSGGAPKETLLLADAAAIYAELTKTMPEDRIVIFGESLGSGIALDLARRARAKAVILDSPYLSVLARGQESYPWLPVSLLLVDQFRSDLKIGAVSSPVFIMHGTADRTIPHTDSEKLAALGRPGNVTRKVYPGEPHVVPYDRGPNVDIPAFLSRIAARQ